MASLYLRRGKYKEGVAFLMELKRKTKYDLIVNVMISFALKKFLNNAELGEKFLYIAIRAKLRELN